MSHLLTAYLSTVCTTLSQVWKAAIHRYIQETLTNEANLLFLRSTNLSSLLKKDAEGKETAKTCALFTSKVFPVLSLLSGVDCGITVGSRVKTKRGKVRGIVLGASTPGSNAYKVLWDQSEKETHANQAELVLEEEEEGFSFDFDILLCPRKLRLLILASGFGKDSPLRLRKGDLERLTERYLTWSAGRRSPTKTRTGTDKASSFRKAPSRLEKRDKRSSSLPDGRTLQDAATSASVERLTNILVTSIIDEVTGKTSPTRRAPTESPPPNKGKGSTNPEVMGSIREESEAKTAPRERGESKPRKQAEGRSESENNPLTESDVLSVLGRAAAIKLAAGKILLALLDSESCDRHLEEAPSEAEEGGVTSHLRTLVSTCWEAATSPGPSAMPLAAPVQTLEVERAMGIIRSETALIFKPSFKPVRIIT